MSLFASEIMKPCFPQMETEKPLQKSKKDYGCNEKYPTAAVFF